MKRRITECEEYKSDPKIVLEENNKKIIFLNPNRDKILVIRVDNCVIKSEQNKCDYALIPCESVEIYVELKGKDVSHAIKQLESTIELLSENKDKIKKLCFIVSSRVPKSGTDVQKLKIDFKKKYNAVLSIKNIQHSYDLSEIL